MSGNFKRIEVNSWLSLVTNVSIISLLTELYFSIKSDEESAAVKETLNGKEEYKSFGILKRGKYLWNFGQSFFKWFYNRGRRIIRA